MGGHAVQIFIAISIHAPAGGATPALCISGRAAPISIRAPAGGATVTSYVTDVTTWIFQFAPLREGRPSTFSASSSP